MYMDDLNPHSSVSQLCLHTGVTWEFKNPSAKATGVGPRHQVLKQRSTIFDTVYK